MKTVMKTILSLTLAAAIAAGYILSTGVYNMAATEKHWLITEKLIEWMRINSIDAHADALQVPEMDEAEYLTVGAIHYNAMCTECHLAPGLEPTELAQGLYPQAPVFGQRQPLSSTEAIEKQANAYFWIIKNGSPGSQMPPYQLFLSDDQIWKLVLYIRTFTK